MGRSIHDFVDDPRNADIRIWINGTLKPYGASAGIAYKIF